MLHILDGKHRSGDAFSVREVPPRWAGLPLFLLVQILLFIQPFPHGHPFIKRRNLSVLRSSPMSCDDLAAH
jgi:hypothetical protein